MSTTTGIQHVIPEVVSAALKPLFRNLKPLYDTGAVVFANTLPGGKTAGQLIRMPKFGRIGGLQTPAEGDPLTVRTLATTQETATVKRYGNAASVTVWAENAASEDLEGEIARQFYETAVEGIAADVVAASILDTTSTGGGTVPLYTTAAGTAPFTYDEMLAAQHSVYGDKMLNNNAALGMNSAEFIKLSLLKNGNNDYYVKPPSALGGLSTFFGLPIIVNDLYPTGSTFIYKKGAMGFWFQETPRVEADRDILADEDVMAINFYGVPHRYRDVGDGSDQPGVLRVDHG